MAFGRRSARLSCPFCSDVKWSALRADQLFRNGDARMFVEDMVNDILPPEMINDKLQHHLTPIPADLSRKENVFIIRFVIKGTLDI